MKRFRGPSLKKPSGFKVPAAVQDVYFDLRDRRLLPLIALIVVAIVAVPIVLSEGPADSGEPPTPSTSPNASASNAASKLTVVRSNPGLRDYHRRLRGRDPTDPFKQRYTGVNLAGTQLASPTESTEGSASTEPSVTVPSVPGSSSETVESGGAGPPHSSPPANSGNGNGGNGNEGNGNGNGGNGNSGTTGELTFFAFAIDVQIAKTGGKNPGPKQEPTIKKEVLPLTPLPGEKTPVVTYMGATKKGNALLLVSTEVRSVFGDAKCASGEDVCQLLEVETDLPVVFVYGAGETRYRINVLKIEPVVTGHG